jgi:molybdopterin/thiamine biosynthesis adenylyltransferase
MGYLFLVRQIIPMSKEDLLNGGRFGLQLSLPALLRVMNQANRDKVCLVEAHSHPFAHSGVTFSYADMNGLKEIMDYLFDVNPRNPYGAIVLGTASVDGLVWLPGKARSEVFRNIRVVGSPLRTVSTTSAMKRRKPSHKAKDQKLEEESRFSRQILAFGKEGQDLIKQATVGIVGLGGLGAHVVQQLSYLGVENFVLVDFDMIEEHNLNRLIGAGRTDIGKAKVDVAEKVILSINPKARKSVRKIKGDIRTEEALDALREVDVLFGCLDRDAPRLIMTELASAYLIPYIDCGAGITVCEGKITEAGGRVVVALPGSPCLLCAKEINLNIAAEELETPEELEFRRRYGYIMEEDVPAPSVVSLNGTIASIAVTEFIALLTSFRAPRHYSFYDMLEEKVVHRIVKHNQKCVACAQKGLGDSADLKRYLRRGLPTDIPRL